MTHTADIALTITLKPSLYDRSWQQQLLISIDDIREAFKDDKMTCVAELTSNSNVHYHCLLSICRANLGTQLDPIKAYVKRKLKAPHFGYFQMKAVTNYNGWVNYIKKASLKLVVDDYNIYAEPEFIFNDYDNTEEYYRSGYLFNNASAIAQERPPNLQDEACRIECEA